MHIYVLMANQRNQDLNIIIALTFQLHRFILYPEEHYADYFKNRDPRMAMTLYCPGDKWPGGDDGDAETRKPNAVFNLPRFSSLQSGNNGANGRTGFYFKKYKRPKYCWKLQYVT
jgi:hypothetical protein